MLFLTEPALEYRERYLEALREIQGEGLRLFEDLRSISADFAAFIQRLQDEKNRAKIALDRVPAFTFWLIDKREFIGWLSLRHELNEYLFKIAGHIGYMIRPSKRRRGYGNEILRLGLLEAKKLGLRRVLLTCDEDNTGSKKIIELNGGRFENMVEVQDSSVKKIRYWIDIPCK